MSIQDSLLRNAIPQGVPSSTVNQKSKGAKSSSKALDQYFTQPKVSRECIGLVRSLYPHIQNFLEPSAGAGAFIDPLREAGCRIVGFDIEPKRPDIHQANFLSLSDQQVLGLAKVSPAITVVVGNPPFGRSGDLAAQFINKCLLLGLAVAFILPRTARRYRFQKGLRPDACLIHDSDLSSDAFILDGASVTVGCCFQIWTLYPGNRPDLRIRTKPRQTHPDFVLQQYNAQGKDREGVLSGLLNGNWVLAVKRQGFGRYELIELNQVPNDPRKHWLFIRVNAPVALRRLRQIDFGKLARRKAVRAPGISYDDVVAEYEAIVAKGSQGFNDNDPPLPFAVAG
jgi:predicted RNA methylase